MMLVPSKNAQMRYIPFFGTAGGAEPPEGPHELLPSGTPIKFGWSCDVSRDGSTVAIGDNDAEGGSGRVHIFTDPDEDGSWPEEEVLDPPTGEGDIAFGYNVALSADGNILAVTSVRENVLGYGVIHIYDRSGSSWSHTQTIEFDYFTDRSWNVNPQCEALCLDDSGDRLFMGSSTASTDLFGTGYAVCFKRTTGTYAIEHEEGIDEPTAFNGWGFTIDVNGAGDTWAISEHFFDGVGRITVNTRSGTTWSVEDTLTYAEAGSPAGGGYPYKVCLSADGDTLVAVNQLGDYSVSFTRSGTTWTKADDFDSSNNSGNATGLTPLPDRAAAIDSNATKLVFGDVNVDSGDGTVCQFTGSSAVFTEGSPEPFPDDASASAPNWGNAVAMPGSGAFFVGTAPFAKDEGGITTGRAWVIYP